MNTLWSEVHRDCFAEFSKDDKTGEYAFKAFLKAPALLESPQFQSFVLNKEGLGVMLDFLKHPSEDEICLTDERKATSRTLNIRVSSFSNGDSGYQFSISAKKESGFGNSSTTATVGVMVSLSGAQELIEIIEKES